MRYITLLCLCALLASCSPTIPVSKQPTHNACVEITLKAKQEVGTFYYCPKDSSQTDAAATILKYLNVE